MNIAFRTLDGYPDNENFVLIDLSGNAEFVQQISVIHYNHKTSTIESKWSFLDIFFLVTLALEQ